MSGKIDVEIFDGKWPEGYLRQESEYCELEMEMFKNATYQLELARKAVQNKRVEFYKKWTKEKGSI